MATADTAAIDDFLNAFRSQIDSGFGTISGDVHVVFGTLIVISVGSSAIMWALDENRSIPAEFIRKILLVGFFAWLIDNWQSLSTSVVQGFASLGLKAGSGSLSVDDFLGTPTKIISAGFTVVIAILNYIGSLCQQGYGVGLFAHFDVILISAICAVGILVSFVVLAAEIAVTLIEFHVVTLIAFVTIPFGIVSQTAFLADRAIGYVISVGLKVMALGLVVSIGQSVFSTYIVSPSPTASEECGLLLSSVVMLVLALKIPAIASGLVTGGPSLTAASAASGLVSVGASLGAGALIGGVAGAASGVARSMFGNPSDSVEATLRAAGLSDREAPRTSTRSARSSSSETGAAAQTISGSSTQATESVFKNGGLSE